MAEPDAASLYIIYSFIVYFPQMVPPIVLPVLFGWFYILKVKIITRLDLFYLLSVLIFLTNSFFFFSGLSNIFAGKSNHHCHVSAYEKSFPIKPVPSPSWSGSCRRSLLSPKKTQRRHVSTAEEVRKTCDKSY